MPKPRKEVLKDQIIVCSDFSREIEKSSFQA